MSAAAGVASKKRSISSIDQGISTSTSIEAVGRGASPNISGAHHRGSIESYMISHPSGSGSRSSGVIGFDNCTQRSASKSLRPASSEIEHSDPYSQVLTCIPCRPEDHVTRKNCKANILCVYGLKVTNNKSSSSTNSGTCGSLAKEDRCIWSKSFSPKMLLGLDPKGSRRGPENPHCGLQNLGSTCYLNVILQIMFHNISSRLSIYLTDVSELTDPATKYNEKELNDLKAIRELQILFRQMESGSSRAVSSENLVRLLGMSTQIQQDPQEFFKLFLSRLEKYWKRTRIDLINIEDNSNSNNRDNNNNSKIRTNSDRKISSNISMQDSLSKRNNTFEALDSLYSGIEKTEIMCSNCKTKSVRATTFTELKLFLGNSPESAPDNLSNETSNSVKKENSNVKDKESNSSAVKAKGSAKEAIRKDDYNLRIVSLEDFKCDSGNKKSSKSKHNFDLKNSLESYFSEESLIGENKYMCSKCGVLRDAVKRVYIGADHNDSKISSSKLDTRSVGKYGKKTTKNGIITPNDINSSNSSSNGWPKLVQIQLLRYKFDIETGARQKIRREFHYPSNINLGGEEYFLSSTIYHKGTSAYGGHYVCDVFSVGADVLNKMKSDLSTSSFICPDNLDNISLTGDWYHCDDDTVVKTTSPADDRVDHIVSIDSDGDDGEELGKDKDSEPKPPRGFDRQKDVYLLLYVNKRHYLQTLLQYEKLLSVDEDANKFIELDRVTYESSLSDYNNSSTFVEDLANCRRNVVSEVESALAVKDVISEGCDEKFHFIPSKWLESWLNGDFSNYHDTLSNTKSEFSYNNSNSKGNKSNSNSRSNSSNNNNDNNSNTDVISKVSDVMIVDGIDDDIQIINDNPSTSVENSLKGDNISSNNKTSQENGNDYLPQLYSRFYRPINMSPYLCIHGALNWGKLSELKIISHKAYTILIDSINEGQSKFSSRIKSFNPTYPATNYDIHESNFRCSECYSEFLNKLSTCEKLAKLVKLIDKDNSSLSEKPQLNKNSSSNSNYMDLVSSDIQPSPRNDHFLLSLSFISEIRRLSNKSSQTIAKSLPNVFNDESDASSRTKSFDMKVNTSCLCPHGLLHNLVQKKSKVVSRHTWGQVLDIIYEMSAKNSDNSCDMNNSSYSKTQLSSKYDESSADNQNCTVIDVDNYSNFGSNSSSSSSDLYSKSPLLNERGVIELPLQELSQFKCSTCQKDIDIKSELKKNRSDEVGNNKSLNLLLRRKMVFGSDLRSAMSLHLTGKHDQSATKFYLIDHNWLDSWRNYISDMDFAAPTTLRNSSLRCEHGMSLISQPFREFPVIDDIKPYYPDEILDEFDVAKSELVSEEQWNSLVSIYAPKSNDANSSNNMELDKCNNSNADDKIEEVSIIDNSFSSNQIKLFPVTLSFAYDKCGDSNIAPCILWDPAICSVCMNVAKERYSASRAFFNDALITVVSVMLEEALVGALADGGNNNDNNKSASADNENSKEISIESDSKASSKADLSKSASKPIIKRSRRASRDRKSSASISCSSNDTVGVLKLKIFESYGDLYFPTNQRLFYNGKELMQEHQTLHFYDVLAGSKVHVVLRGDQIDELQQLSDGGIFGDTLFAYTNRRTESEVEMFGNNSKSNDNKRRNEVISLDDDDDVHLQSRKESRGGLSAMDSTYANNLVSENSSNVDKLVNMGFNESSVKKALKANNNNFENALNFLLSA